MPSKLTRLFWNVNTGGESFNKSLKNFMMNYAFNFVENIILYINENNIRSQKAVEKLGGQRIERLNDIMLEPRPNSTVIYKINRAKDNYFLNEI